MWAFLNPNVPENCVTDSSAIQIFYEKHRLASGTARKPVFVEKYDWSLFWNIKERNFNWAHGHLNALPRNKIKAVTIQRKTKLENENHAEKFNPLRDVTFQRGNESLLNDSKVLLWKSLLLGLLPLYKLKHNVRTWETKLLPLWRQVLNEELNLNNTVTVPGPC